MGNSPKRQAVAYFRTSSAANVGPEKDSKRRQQEAVVAYAKAQKLELVASFYDAGVSGAEELDKRPEFANLLDRCKADGVTVVLIETANRFARDLAVQLAGHGLMKRLGIELVPVDAPIYFTDPSPTAVMVTQILGAVSQFQKANLVLNLRHAREHVRKAKGRCEGRRPAPDAAVAMAKSLARTRKGQKPLSLRAIAAELAAADHTVLNKDGTPTGRPYLAESVKLMLARAA